jgi:hypothetical protein
MRKIVFAASLCLLSATGPALAQDPTAVKRITTIADAFGEPSALRRDWGYASFLEYDGKRILFDTASI